MMARLNPKSQRTVWPRRAAAALGTVLALGLVGGGCGEGGGDFFVWFVAVYSASCGANDEGQLGIADQDLNTYLNKRGLQQIRGSDGGAGHTVAISSDGKAFTNGANAFGQLGNGTTTPHIAPAEVPGLTDVKQVQAGWFHTVALTEPPPGLRGRQFGSEAKVYAWGDNFFGQLGDGGVLTHSTTPVLVPIVGDVREIHVGQWDTSFALMEDGTVQGWGVNANGELGDGTDVNRFSPTPIPGLTDVVKIAGGGQHTLFLLGDGTVKATGMNTMGQLGLGISDPKVFVPTVIPGLTDVVDVAAGAEHSIAVSKDGRAFTWGRNFEGQLGTGPTPNSRNVPGEVTGLNCAAKAAAGLNFTWIVRWDGTVRSFGDNQRGQLGDGTTVNRNVPTVPDTPPARVFHAAAGHNHTLLGGSEQPYILWTVNRQGVAVQTGDVRYLPISVFEAGSSTPMDSEVVVCSPDGGMLAGLHAYPSHLTGPLTVRVRRHETFLSEVVEVPVPAGADVDLGIIQLRNGDVNGDNSVGIPDFIQLRNAFGSVPSSPNWNPNADLNRDGSVSIADFLIFRSNFGASGG